MPDRLEKKLSPINAVSLALGCIIGWGAFVMPGNTFLPNAGPLGTAIAMAIAALIMIVIAFNYDYMIRRHPVAGGEYTYARECFGEKNGFICSWFLGLSYLAIVPLNATALALVGRNLMGNIFAVGLKYTVAGYDIYAGEIALAVVALGLFAWLSVRGVNFTGAFQTILVFLLVGGVLVVTIAAFVSGRMDISRIKPLFGSKSYALAANYNSLIAMMGGGSAADIAAGEAMVRRSIIAGICAVIAVAPWAFVGFDTIPQASEEFRFSVKKTRIIMVLSIVFGALIYVVLNTVTASVVPRGLSSWAVYIEDIGNLDGLISLPTFYAAYQLLGDAGLWCIGIAVLGAILSGIVGFYMATSRLLFSMARDGVLPKRFGVLHPKYKTPFYAILFVMIISMIAPFFGRTALGWIVDMSSTGAAVGYGYTSLAALVTALRERRNADTHAGIIVTGVLGVIFALLFLVLLLVPIPGLSCSLSTEAYICLGIWIVMGVVFYLIRRR